MRLNPRHLLLLFLISALSAADSVDEKIIGVSKTYTNRIEEASVELATARKTIMEERAPLAREIRELESKVIQLNSRITGLATQQADAGHRRSLLDGEMSSLARNLDYAVLLAKELTVTMEASLQPGELSVYGDQLKQLEADLGHEGVRAYQTSMEAFDLVLNRLKSQLGGNISNGLAVVVDSNAVSEGQFLQLGPDTFFRDTTTGRAGLAYQREGSLMPVIHPIPAWDKAVSAAVFSGEPGYVLADATGGKAIHLMEAKGSALDHIRKGGIVGYVIIALGMLALLTALMKLKDLRGLAVDDPDTIKGQIAQINHGGKSQSAPSAGSLKQTCQELFAIALQHRDKPKELLEELMFAYILLQRNLHERRLPMLRVIASAAPLLGLLGTVVGMIKTFTLITVMGTGNAANLSSGISEALVTTELGLIVAIPTLILYGYLSHQTEKRLSLLEQYSIELANNLKWTHGASTAEEDTPNG